MFVADANRRAFQHRWLRVDINGKGDGLLAAAIAGRGSGKDMVAIGKCQRGGKAPFAVSVSDNGRKGRCCGKPLSLIDIVLLGSAIPLRVGRLSSVRHFQ